MSNRGPNWSEAEDLILLRSTDTQEVQQRLVDAGFPPRTQASIHSRRLLLRQAHLVSFTPEQLAGAADELVLLAKKAEAHADRIDELTLEVQAQRDMMSRTHERIRELTAGRRLV